MSSANFKTGDLALIDEVDTSEVSPCNYFERESTVIGNVLGSTSDTGLGLPPDLGTASATQNGPATTSQVYIPSDGADGLAILTTDQTDVVWTSMWLTGNFDTVNKAPKWNASPMTASLSTSTQSLPASLYLSARPAWWPPGNPWPWVGPDLSPKVSTLPAEQLSSAFNYYSTSDPSCSLNCGNQCCSVAAACSL